MDSKISKMHEIFGAGPERAICWNCLFCHWKIEGKGEQAHVAYKWCEIYGLDKKDVTKTEWNWKYPACGWYGVTRYPERKDIYKEV